MKETKPLYYVSKSTKSEIDIPDMKLEDVDKVLKFHVENSSLSSLKLKKEDILGEISQINEDSLELSNPVKITKTDICVEKLNVGELHKNERNIFYNILNNTSMKYKNALTKKQSICQLSIRFC